MFIAVIGRRLRPGATHHDLVRAWYPDRGERIDHVVESCRVHAIYEVLAEYGFSSDETVERDRPDAAGGA
jgi:hypothetical protein